MSLFVAINLEVVMVLYDDQLDTNNSPEAEKIMMELLDAGEARIVINFS
jgi:hypothetical protein